MGALRPGRGRIPAVKEPNDTESPGWPRSQAAFDLQAPTANGEQGGGTLARRRGRRLTYPSIPRDPTGVHARFRSLNFELALASGLARRRLKKFARGVATVVSSRQLRASAATSPAAPALHPRPRFGVPTFLWVQCMALVPQHWL